MALKKFCQAVNGLSSVSSSHLWRSSVRKSVAVHTRRHNHCNIGQGNPFIRISEEVREAIESKKPVVALETTIYTHGGYSHTYRCSA